MTTNTHHLEIVALAPDELEHQASAPCDNAETNNPKSASSAIAPERLQEAMATPDTLDTSDTSDTLDANASEHAVPASASTNDNDASVFALQGNDTAGINPVPVSESPAKVEGDTAVAEDSKPETNVAQNPDVNASSSSDGDTTSDSNKDAMATGASREPDETAAPATPHEPLAVVNIPKRKPRGASGTRDRIWTRHHALCQMALILDDKFGGYLAASPAIPEPKLCPFLKEVPGKLVELCPWILNATYLNLEDSHAMKKYGIQHGFIKWAVNRLYYFFHPKGRREHPSTRVQLKDVYQEFYDAFRDDVAVGSTITEDRAKEFWYSVADRVPFQAPPKPDPVAVNTQASEVVSQVIVAEQEVSHV